MEGERELSLFILYISWGTLRLSFHFIHCLCQCDRWCPFVFLPLESGCLKKKSLPAQAKRERHTSVGGGMRRGNNKNTWHMLFFPFFSPHYIDTIFFCYFLYTLNWKSGEETSRVDRATVLFHTAFTRRRHLRLFSSFTIASLPLSIDTERVTIDSCLNLTLTVLSSTVDTRVCESG